MTQREVTALPLMWGRCRIAFFGARRCRLGRSSAGAAAHAAGRTSGGDRRRHRSGSTRLRAGRGRRDHQSQDGEGGSRRQFQINGRDHVDAAGIRELHKRISRFAVFHPAGLRTARAAHRAQAYRLQRIQSGQGEHPADRQSRRHLDRLVAAGVTNVGSIAFLVSDPSKALDQAREAAIADARRKAEIYARASGVQLGKVTWVSENRVCRAIRDARRRAIRHGGSGADFNRRGYIARAGHGSIRDCKVGPRSSIGSSLLSPAGLRAATSCRCRYLCSERFCRDGRHAHGLAERRASVAFRQQASTVARTATCAAK